MAEVTMPTVDERRDLTRLHNLRIMAPDHPEIAKALKVLGLEERNG